MGTAKKATAKGKAVPSKSGKGGKGEKASKADAKGKAAADDKSKRKLGLRGAAPWAARHAAKHAAEARARAAEPPLPGSARATIRTPANDEALKQQVGELYNLISQIKQFRRNLAKGFYDIGGLLREIQARRLYESKGYGTFEAFLEREIDLGKTVGLRLVKIVGTFLREAALEHGMDRLINALIALEIPPDSPSGKLLEVGKVPPAPLSSSSLPLKPPGR